MQTGSEILLVSRTQHEKHFFEKSYTKWDGEIIPSILPKKQKMEHISGSIV